MISLIVFMAYLTAAHAACSCKQVESVKEAFCQSEYLLLARVLSIYSGQGEMSANASNESKKTDSGTWSYNIWHLQTYKGDVVATSNLTTPSSEDACGVPGLVEDVDYFLSGKKGKNGEITFTSCDLVMPSYQITPDEMDLLRELREDPKKCDKKDDAKNNDDNSVKENDEKKLEENDQKNAEESDGKKVEENEGKTVEESGEDKVEENGGETVEKSDEGNAEESDGSKVEENEGKTMEENGEDKVEENGGETVEKSDEGNAEESDGSKVEENEGKTMEENGEDKVEENDGETVEKSDKAEEVVEGKD
ncbi:hypothetical protein Aduo_010345 [Ancylostoma duodenale]